MSFFIFSPLQEFVTNQELHIFCYGIKTDGSVFRYTYFYVYFQRAGFSPRQLFMGHSSLSSFWN